MITADPQKRGARLEDVRQILTRTASKEDSALLLALAPVVYAEMPDRIALGLSAEALAARIQHHFRFVVREMPPAFQLYRGVPGIHVSVRNPAEAEARSCGAGEGLPLETTVVQTHTMDAPFIFESVKNYFQKAGLRVFSAIHPTFSVRRQWERIVWLGSAHEEGAKESFCHFQIERIDSRDRLRRIEHEIHAVLKAVFTAVEDFQDMVRTVREIGPRLQSRRGAPGDVESARGFLDWLVNDNYILLGSVKYQLGPDGLPDRISESASGVFTDMALLPVVFPGVMEEVEAHLKPAPDDDRIIGVDYCNDGNAIYHLEPIDDIVIREWAPDGSLAQATLILGRFAKTAFTEKASDIPPLREKQDWLLAHSGALPKSHAYREIRGVFNRLPKRELFYADVQSLKEAIDRIVDMTGDDEIVVFCRTAPAYQALFVAFSRLRYSYKVEHELGRALAEEFGPISFNTSADCGAVMVLLYYFDARKLEHELELDAVRQITASMITTWEDRVSAVLEKAFGEREGRRLYERYVRRETRSGMYRESTSPEEVPEDLVQLESLEGRLVAAVRGRTSETASLKLYSNRPLGLTSTLRTLQNLGLSVTDELQIPLELPDDRRGFLYRFGIECAPDRIAALVGGGERFAEALRALDEKRATDDPLNVLVLSAGLSWREVEVLRTLRNHLLQIRIHYNVDTVNGVLSRNNHVAQALFHAFAARFDPELTRDRSEVVAEADREVARALESVRSLAEDEVLRGAANLVHCALRTNFYQRPERPVVAIKVDSRRVEGMPSPRPLLEIYVHSRFIEGIHLRGGKVARGGIRWSDRQDDFRTEILGLMKTQVLKNAVIVPTGSKGGFVLKGEVPARPALDQYLIDRYREFVSGLLDVTDNIVDGAVLHPPEVVLHDGDDAYLVVAADKGTAHLSDTANSVSAQYGFWLGDAFASGGSAGYDHKKVGITARGAWECIKHHFKNLGMDVQKQPFTMAGIGDMAGDVFGNGALQSRATRLVAAFNHVNIFIDPDPDPERSFKERERLFRLPRSGWRDYDASLISPGGGVFDRSAKAIPLSPEMQALLGLEARSASGEEVVRRILCMKVDLLYNGGIGTYVKAASEEDADVGDRANDRVRVDGHDLGARVVGEGGNLGFTQKARLEFWAKGGLINTDAVDNSGGVDMSDHEVNIKILMDLLVKRGVVKGREERNRILAEMTEEVAALVLADNEAQSRALTLAGLRTAARYDEAVEFVVDMLRREVLSRADDAIPSREELSDSPGRSRGLPRPLLCLLLGHTKLWALDEVMESAFPDSPAARPFLDRYFPKRLHVYAEHFADHALRREIIGTCAVNHVVNNAGILFLSHVSSEAHATVGAVIGAYLEAEEELAAGEKRRAILEAGQAAGAEHEALLALEASLAEATTRRLGA
jgi:glutamate dehydrogenase